MKSVKLSDDLNIKVHGRTNGNRNPVTLFWTGSAVEINIKASTLSVLLEGPYDIYENWIAIEVNGAVVQRLMLTGEKQWIPVFRMMNPNKITNVRIIKEVQAMNGDASHCLKIHEIRHDGETVPVKDRELKIEFIGDSITSGEGSVGTGEDEDWISFYFSHVNSYPYMVAKELNAECRVFSQSGWGVHCSWDNQISCNIPDYYENICSVLPHGDFDEMQVYEKNDFSKWQADFIVVNLGTNDDGAFHNEGFYDEKTKETYKLRMVGDEYVEEDLEKVKESVYLFLKKLRKNNPNAKIFWAFGILGNAMAPFIKEAMERFNKEGDHAEFIELPNTVPGTFGARWHPGFKSHKASAEVILNKIKEYL